MRRTAIFAIFALVLGACSGGDAVRPDDATTTTATSASTVATTTTTGVPSTTTSSTTTTTQPDGITPEDLEAASNRLVALLTAFEAFDWPTASVFLAGASDDAGAMFEQWRSSLAITSSEFTPGDPVAGDATITIPFEVALELEAFGPWEYGSTATLVEQDGGWRVLWEPALLHPLLEEGHGFVRTAEWAPRAAILAVDSTPIAQATDAVQWGVVPERITDRGQLLDDLEELTGVDPATVAGELDRPGVQPDWFLPIALLSAAEREEIGDALIALPGVVFRNAAVRSGPNPGMAALIVGRIGEITAELLERFGPPYEVGDVVGLSGMELAFERTLAGTPIQEIRHVNEFGRTVDIVGSTDGVPPADVVTSLDVATQLAAEAALGAATEPAALVAIDVATGEIRAAATVPADSFDRALGGLYPPGSTFKIVTATALLQSGMSPDDLVQCPAEVIINGRRFRNADERALGTITLAKAFAESCNTTFASLAAERLTNEDLDAVASGFGFDGGYDLPVFDNGGQFPVPPDRSGRAAAAIGQGAVLASPMHMATVAATIAGDGWLEPSLVAGDDTRQRIGLDPEVAASLRDMMRLVVTEGTAGQADVADEAVSGKTGSAEFGTGDDLDTHAWFVGFWDGLAFAVVVEGGGSGGQVAAPIAADFIERLP